MVSASKMVRKDFQKLARQRLRDAKVLLKAGCSSGAYYLTGYAVECALKACIAKKTLRCEFPDKELAGKCHTHELTELLVAAGLKFQYDKDIKIESRLETNWAMAKDWKVTTRYSLAIDQRTAEQFYEAIAGRSGGLMKWLRKHW